MNKGLSLILALLIALLFANVYYWISLKEKGSGSTVTITRVLDGDTVDIAGGERIRLANINAPEKGMPGAEKSADFLRAYQNTTIRADIQGTDKYGRRLVAELYAGKTYLNLELVRRGLVSKAWVADSELKDFADAEKSAIENGQGIWAHSQYWGCISANINAKAEIVTFRNVCADADSKGWWLKDESREVYHFTADFINTVCLHSGKGKDNATDIFWGKSQSVWNDDRDTLYLFDSQNKLVLAKTYGY